MLIADAEFNRICSRALVSNLKASKTYIKGRRFDNTRKYGSQQTSQTWVLVSYRPLMTGIIFY